MSARFKIKGKIHAVDPVVTVGAKAFRKRTFVITSDPHAQYPDYTAFELHGGKTDNTDLVTEADMGRDVEVTFYVSSRKWEDPKTSATRWFTSVVATDVTFAEDEKIAVPDVPDVGEPEPAADDLPF